MDHRIANRHSAFQHSPGLNRASGDFEKQRNLTVSDGHVMLGRIAFHFGQQSRVRRMKILEIFRLLAFNDGVYACFHERDCRLVGFKKANARWYRTRSGSDGMRSFNSQGLSNVFPSPVGRGARVEGLTRSNSLAINLRRGHLPRLSSASGRYRSRFCTSSGILIVIWTSLSFASITVTTRGTLLGFFASDS